MASGTTYFVVYMCELVNHIVSSARALLLHAIFIKHRHVNIARLLSVTYTVRSTVMHCQSWLAVLQSDLRERATCTVVKHVPGT